MIDQWYYLDKGSQKGPITGEQLRALIADGELRATDEVWRQGTPDWKAIRAIPALAASLPVSAQFSIEPQPLPPEPEPQLAETPYSSRSIKASIGWYALSLLIVVLPAALCLVLYGNQPMSKLSESDRIWRKALVGFSMAGLTAWIMTVVGGVLKAKPQLKDLGPHLLRWGGVILIVFLVIVIAVAALTR